MIMMDLGGESMQNSIPAISSGEENESSHRIIQSKAPPLPKFGSRELKLLMPLGYGHGLEARALWTKIDGLRRLWNLISFLLSHKHQKALTIRLRISLEEEVSKVSSSQSLYPGVAIGSKKRGQQDIEGIYIQRNLHDHNVQLSVQAMSKEV